MRANKADYEPLGYTTEEYLGHHISEFHADQDVIEDILTRLGNDERLCNYSAKLRCKDGSILDVLIDSSVLWEDGEFMHTRCFTRDVTHIRRAERALKDSEHRLNLILESAPAMMMVDPDGRIVLVNTETEETFGYTRGELLGQPVELLLPDRHRAEHVDHRTAFFAAPTNRGMGGGRELYGLRKDGSEISVEIGLNPVRTDEGVFVLAAVVDITERRKADNKMTRLVSKLDKSNQELEQFAYVASHDLQEPLRKVAGFCQLLKENYGESLDDDGNTYMDYAVDGAHRMQSLVSDLLGFSRVNSQGKVPKPCDSEAACQAAIGNLEISIQEAGAIVVCDDLPEVLADHGQLVQLFQNMISNGIKYRDASRTPEVHVGVAEKSDHWVFSVRDNGIGISSEHHANIFQIFRRLHARNEFPGTGIGLAICKKIVGRLDGEIWVESTERQGSTFFFTLPKINQPQRSEPATDSMST